VITPEDCEAGYFFAELGQPCQPCPGGTYGPSATTLGSNDACLPCAAGTASAAEGATSCEPCGAGLYSNQEGAQVCDLCLDGTATTGDVNAEGGYTSCSKCAVGVMFC
jgi:hypothetical protein